MEKEVMNNFIADCINKKRFDIDYRNYATLKSEKLEIEPTGQSFTTLVAVAQLRFHNHPKTRERWLK